jgi:putative spermidine/putrescine transport system permease protein
MLLLVGSFGESWFGMLLPTGATLRWYAEVIGDPNLRRAFWVSLQVGAATCVVGVLIGLRSPTRSTRRRRAACWPWRGSSVC